MARIPITLTLQAATTIAAIETNIHGVIPLEGTDWVSLLLDYTKGDETGVYIRWDYAGDYQATYWTFAGNDWTGVEQRIYLTATGQYEFRIDVRGRQIIKFTQDANGGTPTGTLAVKISMT